jgi:hypothetical protein
VQELPAFNAHQACRHGACRTALPGAGRACQSSAGSAAAAMPKLAVTITLEPWQVIGIVTIELMP